MFLELMKFYLYVISEYFLINLSELLSSCLKGNLIIHLNR
jgi:hypothetical protein